MFFVVYYLLWLTIKGCQYHRESIWFRSWVWFGCHENLLHQTWLHIQWIITNH